MQNKRGLLLLKQIIELIIAVIVILILIYMSVVLFRTYFGRQEDLQAQGTLDRIVQKLESLEEAETNSYTLLSPAGWHIVAFDAEHNFNGKFEKPGSMFQQNILCLCEKKCDTKFCRAISLPLKQQDKLVNIEIKIVDIWLSHKIDYYEVTKIEPSVIAKELSGKEQTETGFAYDKMSTENWNNEIPRITYQYYEQYQLNRYVASKEEFEKIVRAMIIQESSTVEDAIGCDGEVGLMQIMPQTAIGLGLNVPDYGLEDISKIAPCTNEKRTSVSKCNIVHPENCNKEEDERFDPIKNIDAGTRYLSERIAEFQNQWLGIAAYNAGSGGVRKNCQPLTITACPSTFSGRQYVELVKAKMELI